MPTPNNATIINGRRPDPLQQGRLAGTIRPMRPTTAGAHLRKRRRAPVDRHIAASPSTCMGQERSACDHSKESTRSSLHLRCSQKKISVRVFLLSFHQAKVMEADPLAGCKTA
jgi:hypothetical protein